MYRGHTIVLFAACISVVGCVAPPVARPVEVGAWGEERAGISLRLRSSDAPFIAVSTAPGVCIYSVLPPLVAATLLDPGRIELCLTIRNDSDIPLEIVLGPARLKHGGIVEALPAITISAEIAGEWKEIGAGFAALADIDLIVTVKPQEAKDVPIFMYLGDEAEAVLHKTGVVYLRAELPIPVNESAVNVISGPIAWRNAPSTSAFAR